jgi:uncharacterized protein with HEPN domain
VPSRSFKNRIRDMLEAIVEIESFTEGITFEEFQQDQITVKAVLYNMAIIGEAANSLMPDIEAIYPEIPWIDVRCMRNVVLHAYFQVNLVIIWQTIKEDLAPLASTLAQLIQ